MGVWGWDEIEDPVTLKGRVIGTTTHFLNDGDWTFKVHPAPAYEYLLTNPIGKTNTNELVECEVEPVVGGSIKSNFPGFPDTWATVVGTWARDRSHRFDGETIGADENGDFGKTEIHPFISLLIERPPAADNRSRTIDFFVFSSLGSSVGPGADAPHTDENRRGTFDALTVRSAFGQDAAFEILGEADLSDSQNEFKFTYADFSASHKALHGDVASGHASEGKGFYHAKIRMTPGYTLRSYMFSRDLDPQGGIKAWMSTAGASSLRDLFTKTLKDLPPK